MSSPSLIPKRGSCTNDLECHKNYQLDIATSRSFFPTNESGGGRLKDQEMVSLYLEVNDLISNARREGVRSSKGVAMSVVPSCFTLLWISRQQIQWCQWRQLKYQNSPFIYQEIFRLFLWLKIKTSTFEMLFITLSK